MKLERVTTQVNIVLPKCIRESLKFIYGQYHVQRNSIEFVSSEKLLFIKNQRTLFVEFPEYNNFNVILVDDSSYNQS